MGQKDFVKVVNPCMVKCGAYFRDVFCKIAFKDGRLSITGVVGPFVGGNCYGSFGQIVDELVQPERKLISEWTGEMLEEFIYIWKTYHLNDLQSACEHQRARGETWTTHPSAVCGDCGYTLGSSWLHMDVPGEVLEFLEGLPETKKTPAWI